jgi:hypothetical protein
MSYTDAPIPTGDAAQFAAWRRHVEERLTRLEHKKQIAFPIRVTGTTDASGFLTFEHGGFTTPKAVIVQPEVPSGGTNIFDAHMVDIITETTARIRALSHTGVALNSVSITFTAIVVY